MAATKTNRHIPSKYIYYSFVCRSCGNSDAREFNKFDDPKNDPSILCHECQEIAIHDSEWPNEWDDDWNDNDFSGYTAISDDDDLPF